MISDADLSDLIARFGPLKHPKVHAALVELRSWRKSGAKAFQAMASLIDYVDGYGRFMGERVKFEALSERAAAGDISAIEEILASAQRLHAETLAE